MARRNQVQRNLARAGVEIQAQPVSSVYYRPNAQRPEMQVLTDFSAISPSIQRFLEDKAERDSQMQLEAGLQAQVLGRGGEKAAALAAGEGIAADPEKGRKQFERRFAKLVNDGEIPEAASPLFQIGYAQAEARSQMGQYRNALRARIAEAATLVGPDGQPQEPIDLEAVIAEEWDKIGGSPAMTNYYGRQVATAMKQQVDEEFLGAASAQRADAISARHRELLQNDVAARFDAMAVSDAPSAEEMSASLQELSQFVSEEVHAKSVRDPRGLVLDAARLAIQRGANVSAQEGLRVLDFVEELKVEGQRLGDDAEAGLELEQIKRDLQRQGESEVGAEVRKENAAIAAVRLKAELEYMTPLNEALEDGVNVTQVEQALAEKFRTDPLIPENMRGFVLDDLRQYSRRLQNENTTAPEHVDALEKMIAQGKTADARLYLQNLDEQDAIRGKDYAAYMGRIQEREKDSQFLEEDAVYNHTVGRMNQKLTVLQEYPAQIESALRARHSDLLEQFMDQATAYVQSPEGQQDPRTRRAQFKALEQQFNAAWKLEVDAVQKDRIEQVATVRENLRRGVDVTGQLAEMARNGLIDSREHQALLDENVQAQDRSIFFEANPDWKDAVLDLKANFAASEVLPQASEQEILQLEGAVEARLRSRMEAWLDENRVITEPGALRGKYRQALQTALDEELTQISARPPAILKARIAAGEKTLEAGAEEAKLTDNLNKAQAVEALEATGKLAEYKPGHPSFVANPDVPGAAYDTYSRFVSGRGAGLFTGKPKRQQVLDKFAREALAVLNRQDLDQSRREDAVLDLYSKMGMTPEMVLADEITVETPEYVKSYVTERASYQAEMLRYGSDFAKLNRLLGGDPPDVPLVEKVSIAGKTLPAYTMPLWTRPEEMMAFKRSRPDDWARLLKRLEVPDGEAGEAEFMDHQLSAIRLAQGR